MNVSTSHATALIALFVISAAVAARQSSTAIDDGVYLLEQAENGAAIYARECAACHGAELGGSEIGPSLVGRAFIDRWRGRTLEEFFLLNRDTMPLARPGALSASAYADLVAYMLNRNGYVDGDARLTAATMSKPSLVFADAARSTPIPLSAAAEAGGLTVEWLHHRGDPGSMNYSPLDLIDRDNVDRLEVAWRWRSDNFGPEPWPNLQTTPIMANGVLYATAGARRAVVAIDATSGETLWMYRLDEGARGDFAPRKGPGRGVAYRRGDNGETIYFISPGYHLVALDAQTGQPRPSFGSGGIVDLKLQLDQDIDPDTARVGASSPPIVVGDVVIVGSAFPPGGAPPTKEMPAGHVTAYDVVTGERRWIFHTIPRPGEYGHETWEDGSWKYTGNAGVWAPMSADSELGYVYLPVEAATGDYYGGHRPGDNLFTQSIVCLDARTGERVWHFQTVHHDIWDYDPPAAPVLLDITVDGRDIPAVAQITKHGYTFVFDRRDGTPVWPIEEVPVPASDVPGEIAAPTQPIPTLPEMFEPNGVTEDRLNDLTPEILAEAKRVASEYTLGPAYTPPTVYSEDNKGTLFSPDGGGAANWQGAVVDPETGMFYVSSAVSVGSLGLVSDPDRSNMRYVAQNAPSPDVFGLPLLKPPWGRITAIDMNTGKVRWTIANADTPEEIRTHEKLRGVELPRTGHQERAGLLVTKTLLFAGEGSGLYTTTGGGTKFRAHDKGSGEILAEVDLGLRQSGVPMTYAVNGRQYVVVAVGAPGEAGQLVALAVGDQ